MLANICGFIVLFALAMLTALAVDYLMRKSLRALLDDLVQLPPCTVFYSRLLTIGLVFIAISSALGTEFSLKADAAFMEYVWKAAHGLSSVFGNISLFLVAYLIVVTVLVAAWRRKRD
jgi:hypothetical protein